MITNDFIELPLDFQNEITSSEKLRAEFKESYAEREEIRETMMAFANAVGGRIYVGIREVKKELGVHVGQIIGVTKPGISYTSSNVRQWATSFIPKFRCLDTIARNNYLNTVAF